MLKRLALLARSMLAGAAATLVDLGTLFLLVDVVGVAPRVASVPALLLAGSVMFVGNRRFAFRATSSAGARQALRFAGVHAVTLTLNAALFDLAMSVAGGRAPYWAVRLVVGNAVFLAWSFPMFRRVFGARDAHVVGGAGARCAQKNRVCSRTACSSSGLGT